MAVAVIPGVFAMSRNAGPISNILGGRNSESTIWQALQASRCERMPGREITVLRFRTERRYSQAAAPSTTAHLWHMAVLFPIGAVDSTMASHRMRHDVLARAAIATTIAVAVRPIGDNSRTPPYARFDPTRTFGRPYVADCLPKRTSRFRANQNRQLS